MNIYSPDHKIYSNDGLAPFAPCAAAARFLKVDEVASRLSISVSTVWRLAKTEDAFPRPKRIAIRSTRWMLSEIEAYETTRRLTR